MGLRQEGRAEERYSRDAMKEKPADTGKWGEKARSDAQEYDCGVQLDAIPGRECTSTLSG